MKKVVVVGGGASGMVAAIYAAKNNDVTILEKNSKLGKKLLITGAGRCNYWNSDMDIKYYHSNNKALLTNLICSNNREEIMSFFDTIGLVPTIKDGYYYPYSKESIAVLNALEMEIKRLNIKVILDTTVDDICKSDDFIISTSTGTYLADKVIISSGSCACPKTGSTGDLYDILTNLGHSIIKPLPALTGLVGIRNYKEWSGNRCEVYLSLYENKNLVTTSTGEIQLNDYGVSGICVMNLSSIVSRGLDSNKKETLFINFIPFVNYKDGMDYINKRNHKYPGRTIIELLESIVSYKVLYAIFKLVHIDSSIKWDDINNKQKQVIVDSIFNFRFDIKETKDFTNAQTVTGGIPLTEVTPHCESKIQQDLYITGELLDCDGNCGGYNLGFAFITGMVAGRDCNE